MILLTPFFFLAEGIGTISQFHSFHVSIVSLSHQNAGHISVSFIRSPDERNMNKCGIATRKTKQNKKTERTGFVRSALLQRACHMFAIRLFLRSTTRFSHSSH